MPIDSVAELEGVVIELEDEGLLDIATLDGFEITTKRMFGTELVELGTATFEDDMMLSSGLAVPDSLDGDSVTVEEIENGALELVITELNDVMLGDERSSELNDDDIELMAVELDIISNVEIERVDNGLLELVEVLLDTAALDNDEEPEVTPIPKVAVVEDVVVREHENFVEEVARVDDSMSPDIDVNSKVEKEEIEVSVLFDVKLGMETAAIVNVEVDDKEVSDIRTEPDVSTLELSELAEATNLDEGNEPGNNIETDETEVGAFDGEIVSAGIGLNAASIKVGGVVAVGEAVSGLGEGLPSNVVAAWFKVEKTDKVGDKVVPELLVNAILLKEEMSSVELINVSLVEIVEIAKLELKTALVVEKNAGPVSLKTTNS
ncbi:hypothetical protein K432DRAFT_390692 [Lepidopterella palustris CBS 459.81]|uniref:Uncharacterized protein n=1 Tax=Lepidopterella palustris CBS 459.81 TaxID=1314670 RepID=A0A8E2EG03_9PEZI|nr:hypothetical protein K432DRAFT_390692 [Lepidopterella palustris CBS 459.81]